MPAMILLNSNSSAQEATKTLARGAWYFSWGYNQEWYSNSTVHVKQSELGNDYDLVQVAAHDHKGWDQHLFKQQLTIPQYNYRIGHYFNQKQDLGIEINFDHTKYIIADGQTINVRGTYNHSPINDNILFTENNGFYYYLNNGANFLLFNIVKKASLYQSKDGNLFLDLIGKAGIGPVIPHVQNSLFGHANDPSFQLGGWNTGLETAYRLTVMKYGFAEFSQKVDYARYSHLHVYKGLASQHFSTYEFILSVGVVIPSKWNKVSVSKADSTDGDNR